VDLLHLDALVSVGVNFTFIATLRLTYTATDVPYYVNTIEYLIPTDTANNSATLHFNLVFKNLTCRL